MREVVSEQKTDAELEEIKKLKELSKKYKGCRCSRYCSVWNRWENITCRRQGAGGFSCRNYGRRKQNESKRID